MNTNGTRRARLRTFAAVLLVLLAALAVLPGGAPAARAAPDASDRPLTRAQTSDDRVALTFDVTWQENELAKIMATLDAAGVKATFFVGGTFVALYGENVRTMVAKGHEVGTLGQRVVDLSGQSEQEVSTNLLASQSALGKLLGGPVRYFRPPMGAATPAMVRGARTAGLVTVMHSLDSEDYSGISAGEIVRSVVKRARKGDIIRLTASDWCKETTVALPGIIQGLQARRYKLVRLSELGQP